MTGMQPVPLGAPDDGSFRRPHGNWRMPECSRLLMYQNVKPNVIGTQAA